MIILYENDFYNKEYQILKDSGRKLVLTKIVTIK